MNNAGGENIFLLLNTLLLMFILTYFVLIRPRRKKEKEMEQLRGNLVVGDVVTTIGGIVGIVVSIKEDGVTLETGSDRNKIRIKKWAIQSVENLEKADANLSSEEKNKNLNDK